MNSASQQLTRRQNRRSEAADDAGIARKRRVTALMAAKYVSICIACVMSMWRAVNLITGDTFWKPATGWQPIYRLTSYHFNKPSFNY